MLPKSVCKLHQELSVLLQEFKATLQGLQGALDSAHSHSYSPYSLTGKSLFLQLCLLRLALSQTIAIVMLVSTIDLASPNYSSAP